MRSFPNEGIKLASAKIFIPTYKILDFHQLEDTLYISKEPTAALPSTIPNGFLKIVATAINIVKIIITGPSIPTISTSLFNPKSIVPVVNTAIMTLPIYSGIPKLWFNVAPAPDSIIANTVTIKIIVYQLNPIPTHFPK